MTSQEDIERGHQLISWLPTDTETVAVQYEDREIGRDVEARPGSVAEAVGLLLSQPLIGIAEGHYWRRLNGLVVARAVLGARAFRPPTGLGSSRFDGCYLYEFSQSSVPALEGVLEELNSTAKEMIAIGEQQVAVFEETLEQDTWTFYVTAPSPGLLLCGSDRRYLEEVLMRRADADLEAEADSNAVLWRHVTPGAQIALIRNYRKEGLQDDFTSPYSETSAWPDNEAVGLIYAGKWQDARNARVVYVSGHERALEIADSAWSENAGSGMGAEVKRESASVIEIMLPVGTPEDIIGISGDVLLHFGFVIAL